MKKILAVAALASAMVAGSATTSQAAALFFVPATQTVPVGTNPVLVDLVIGGLVPGVTGLGAFDIDILLSNPGVVGFNGYTLTSYLGVIGVEADDFSIGFSGNTINLQLLSYLTASQLLALQAPTGGTFTLATLSFSAQAVGTTLLTVSRHVLSNEDGTATLPAVPAPGQINVVGVVNPPQVPEPATLVIAALGLLGFARSRTMRNARRG